MIDWVYEQNKSGPLAGKLDLDRIVLSGNSCGGVTAEQGASSDDRVAAVYVLSGSSAVGSSNKQVVSNIKVPIAWNEGSKDDISRSSAEADFKNLNKDVPAMIIARYQGQHMGVSTNKKWLKEEAEMATNWLDLALYGTKGAYDILMTEEVCTFCDPEHYSIVLSQNLEKLIK
jgi:dienelactone hydrolase